MRGNYEIKNGDGGWQAPGRDTKEKGPPLIQRETLLWAQQGTILRPPDYESGALTS